jgi:hypothetical protein
LQLLHGGLPLFLDRRRGPRFRSGVGGEAVVLPRENQQVRLDIRVRALGSEVGGGFGFVIVISTARQTPWIDGFVCARTIALISARTATTTKSFSSRATPMRLVVAGFRISGQ